MKWVRAIAVMSALFVLVPSARADFIIDLFEEPPIAPTHTSTPGGSTYLGPFSAPQVITSRTLTGRAPFTLGFLDLGALRAGAGLALSALAPGETAIYTAMFPAQDFMTNNILDLINFVNLSGLNTATIDVFVNGALVGSTLFGPGFAPDITLTGASAAGTSLDLVFTASVTNLGGFSFSGDGIAAVQAVPEPATMTLLGLGMSGVAVGFWRKRKKDKAPVEVAC